MGRRSQASPSEMAGPLLAQNPEALPLAQYNWLKAIGAGRGTRPQS
jgi:hypothetical protein